LGLFDPLVLKMLCQRSASQRRLLLLLAMIKE
jgi:hypothetical protein